MRLTGPGDTEIGIAEFDSDYRVRSTHPEMVRHVIGPALVRAHLLNTNPDPNFQISVIEEAMSNFHRYFFIMPTLARLELEMHTRIEQGKALSAQDLIKITTDLYAEGYGESDPIVANDTKDNKAKNRRIAFTITEE